MDRRGLAITEAGHVEDVVLVFVDRALLVCSERPQPRLARQQGVQPSPSRLQLLNHADELVDFDSSLLLQVLESLLRMLVLAGNLQLFLPVALLGNDLGKVTSHTDELPCLAHDPPDAPSFDQGVQEPAPSVDRDYGLQLVLAEALPAPYLLDRCRAVRHKVLEDCLLLGLDLLASFFQRSDKLLDELVLPFSVSNR